MYDLVISGLNSSVAFAIQTKVPIAVGFYDNPGLKQFVHYSNAFYTLTAVNRFTFKLKGVKNVDPKTVHFIHFLN